VEEDTCRSGQPLPEATVFLEGRGYSTTVETDGSLLFTPDAPGGKGIVIMHGALIKPLAYAKAGAFFSARGYTVFIPHGAARLSINAVDAAAERISRLPATSWYLIGHSMGGFSSLELLAWHAPAVEALAMWACAMPARSSRIQWSTCW